MAGEHDAGMMPLKHRRVAVLLVLAVIAAHVFFTDALLTQLAELAPASRAPDRIDVNFVSEVRLSAPPQAIAPPPTKKLPGRPKRKALPPPDEAASAPAPVASAPDLGASGPNAVATAASAASQPEAPASSASSAQAAASAPQPAASSATATAKPFEWPASTRIKFKLTGQYRGEVQGSAQVDWLLSGTHYQVHVDTIIGPKFAPIFRRSVSSDGEISEQGLHPRRYDEETKVAIASPKRKYVLFEGDEVELSESGKREPRLPGVQDAASLFVQFTYSFTTNPSQLAAGNVVVIPLALPRKQEPITYDVIGMETLDTPLGALPTVHVKPRVPPRPGKPDLTVELWFAPNLEYLPVRMRAHQDEQNYLDMLIDGPPLRGETKLTGQKPASPANQ
ncbi:DUF3108 domain-containing protein [Aquabacterium sp.]|uniref:DUF3108 domain-containing protein n=1 Tax=Aquabacterium sp. TaxID=1872578 RepID=UPI0035AEF171